MFRGQRVLRRVAGKGASAHSEVEVVASEAGVSAGFGVAARAHQRDAERRDGIAQGRGFACAQDEADARKMQAERAEQLDKIAIADRMRDRRVLLGTEGSADNVLKIRPPMTFDAAAASRLLETLDEILAEDLAQPTKLR